MKSRYLDGFKVTPHKMLTIVNPCTTRAELGSGVGEGRLGASRPSQSKT